MLGVGHPPTDVGRLDWFVTTLKHVRRWTSRCQSAKQLPKPNVDVQCTQQTVGHGTQRGWLQICAHLVDHQLSGKMPHSSQSNMPCGSGVGSICTCRCKYCPTPSAELNLTSPHRLSREQGLTGRAAALDRLIAFLMEGKLTVPR